MTSQPTLHPQKQLLFACLSVTDLVLTWWLLNQSGNEAYETNPVANWWLLHHGWLGLTCFKLFAVALALGSVTWIAYSRPLVAGRILYLGCACLSVVVGYSVALCALPSHDGDTLAINKEYEPYNRTRAEAIRKRLLLEKVMQRECEAILALRTTLREAAERLEDSPASQMPERIATLEKLYPNRPRVQRSACILIARMVSTLRSPNLPLARRTALWLKGEFQSGFGVPTPPELDNILSLREESAVDAPAQPLPQPTLAVDESSVLATDTPSDEIPSLRGGFCLLP